MSRILSPFLFFCMLMPTGLKAQVPVSISEEVRFSDPGLRGDILFIGGYHGVYNHKGELAVAKQNHDFTGYIPIDERSDSGYVIVNHELMISDPVLGDGGGMTVFTVYRDPASGRWRVVDDPMGKYRSVDFGPVGGTLMNCGGFQTPWGTVLTSEETIFGDNEAIYRQGEGINDTSDYTVELFNGRLAGIPISRYQNFNWMVEVDVREAKAIRKQYNMGRYFHEGGTILPDGRTVVLPDDQAPGYLYKFVAEQTDDLSKGQLYVFRQNDDGQGGTWLPMPMQLDSMIRATDVAARMGATMFVRTEWAVYHNGKVYITETGKDDTGDDMQKAARMGARLAAHLKPVDAADGAADLRIRDYYGRILELDMQTGHIRPYLSGGAGTTHHLSNPDCLALARIDGHTVVMVNEDLNGYSHGRVPPAYGERINEIFCLDLDLTNPTVDDLHQLAVGPAGCETTGGRFTPDGSTYFVNIQHPKTTNTFPFNNSVTVAVRGVDRWIAREVLGMEAPVADPGRETEVQRSDVRKFDRKKVFQVFNSQGVLVMEGRSCTLSFEGLARGHYQLLIDGRLEPLVVR